jgi:outer membrane receptor protein involved in Fe transport
MKFEALYPGKYIITDGMNNREIINITCDKNYQPAVFYTDVTLNFDLDKAERFKGFVTVNNLFDRDPPLTPGFLIAGSNFGNRTLYDMVGRMFSAGVRFNF